MWAPVGHVAGRPKSIYEAESYIDVTIALNVNLSLVTLIRIHINF